MSPRIMLLFTIAADLIWLCAASQNIPVFVSGNNQQDGTMTIEKPSGPEIWKSSIQYATKWPSKVILSIHRGNSVDADLINETARQVFPLNAVFFRTMDLSDNVVKTFSDQQTTQLLRDFSLGVVSKGIEGIREEWRDMWHVMCRTRPPAATEYDKNSTDCEVGKNRFMDVICADRTRVDLDGDYIHANWITSEGNDRFICTQAPKPNTVDDFWKMVWLKKVSATIMLLAKTTPYYPTKSNKVINTKDGLKIEYIAQAENKEPPQAVTHIKISSGTGESMETKHIHWQNWPDMGVPTDIMAPFRILSMIDGLGRVAVHCLAGIGRSGTLVGLFLAFDRLTRKKNAGEGLLRNVVTELRHCRYESVQNLRQYLYMHLSLVTLAMRKGVLMDVFDQVEKFKTQAEARLYGV